MKTLVITAATRIADFESLASMRAESAERAGL